MQQFDTLSKQVIAIIAGRRLAVVAVGLFVTVTAVNAQFPEFTTIYVLAFLVASGLVIVAGYLSRNIVWSIFLGSAPILGE